MNDREADPNERSHKRLKVTDLLHAMRRRRRLTFERYSKMLILPLEMSDGSSPFPLSRLNRTDLRDIVRIYLLDGSLRLPNYKISNTVTLPRYVSFRYWNENLCKSSGKLKDQP